MVLNEAISRICEQIIIKFVSRKKACPETHSRTGYCCIMVLHTNHYENWKTNQHQ